MNCRQWPHGAAVTAMLASPPDSLFAAAFVIMDCSACTEEFRPCPGSSRFAPKYIAPLSPRPAAPTKKFCNVGGGGGGGGV